MDIWTMVFDQWVCHSKLIFDWNLVSELLVVYYWSLLDYGITKLLNVFYFHWPWRCTTLQELGCFFIIFFFTQLLYRLTRTWELLQIHVFFSFIFLACEHCVDKICLSCYKGAAWDPDSRMILIAFSESSTLGSVHFASRPPSLGMFDSIFSSLVVVFWPVEWYLLLSGGYTYTLPISAWVWVSCRYLLLIIIFLVISNY